MKRIDKKLYIYACAFLIPFVMVQAFFALCGIYPYGPSSVLTGDMDVEFVNFFSYFINIFKTKNDFSYMFAKTLGGDFPGLAAFQLHDPLLFLLFFFPGDKVPLGIEFIFSIQLSLAGLFMSILLNERYRRTWMSLLFSTAYSFIAFFFGYLVLMIYFTCIALLPLVIYFLLEYLDGQRSGIPLILTAALHIYINYHMGFMLVIFLTLVYISRLIKDKTYIKKLGGFLLAGVTALLIDGFSLIRTGLSLIGEKTTDTANYGFFRNFPLTQVFANLFSGSTRNQYRPLMYCSVAVIFFALIYFMSKEYEIKEKLASAFLLASVIVSLWINTFDSVWHGFNNPEEFYFRYAYLVSFILVVIAYKGFLAMLDNPKDEASFNKKRMLKAAATFGILVIYIIFLAIVHDAYMDRERQIVNLGLVCFVAVSVFMISLGRSEDGAEALDAGRRHLRHGFRIAGLILLIAVSIPDMLYDAKVTYIKLNARDGVLPEMENFKVDYKRIGEAIDNVKAYDDGFYRIEKDFDRAVNDPALFDYIGLSHDSSCEKDAINYFLTHYGFRETIYYTFYHGGSTSFADAVLGVKYLISDREDSFYKPYEFISDAGGYRTYRDDYALPMAYIAPGAVRDFVFDEDDNTFEKQNKLASCWGDDIEPIYKRADYDQYLEGAEEDEPGHFIRTEDEGYIVYDVHITENMPLYLYFAAPHMQSGEVFVNDESFGWYFTENRWNVLCAGIYDVGDTVEIRMQVLKDDLYITEPCFYYEDEAKLAVWAERASDKDQRISGVNEIKSSHLKFDAEVRDGETIVMSIPYDSAWKIRCDGKRIDPTPATELLMGIDLPEGKHEIEMRYVPHGTLIGLIVSMAGLIMLVIQIRNTKKNG